MFVCVGLFFACAIGLAIVCLLVYERFWFSLLCVVFFWNRVRGLFVCRLYSMFVRLFFYVCACFFCVYLCLVRSDIVYVRVCLLFSRLCWFVFVCF